MPRRSSRRSTVPRITLQVVRQAFANPAEGSPYYLREEGGRDSIRGCMLRIQRRTVQFGTRSHLGTRWHKAAQAQSDMTLEEIEEARRAVRNLVRELEDEEEVPGLQRARILTVRDLMEEYLTDYRETRAQRRSQRTIEIYQDSWNNHLLPLVGDLKLREVTPDVVRSLKREIPVRVTTARPKTKGGGTYAANRALQQLDSAFRFAQRQEWVLRNPAAKWIVPRYEETPSEHFLDEAGYRAVGDVLHEAERAAESRSAAARGKLSIRTLYALRLAIYTGARHRVELLWAELSWCQDLEGKVPRIAIPRAKGDRGDRRGRWIYLGPHAAQLIREMPRPEGSRHLRPGMSQGVPSSASTRPGHGCSSRRACRTCPSRC